MNLRVSVSDLDQVAYYLQSEDMPLETLLTRLRHEEPPSDAMLAGRALHDYLEHCAPGELATVEHQGHTFVFDVDGELSLPPIRELKAEKEYRIDGVTVTLVGKVDATTGQRIDDHKLTSRWDAIKYADSLQWRAYLDIFSARTFRYNVLCARFSRGRWWIYDFHQLPLFWYSGLRADVERGLRDYVGIAREHLPDKLQEAA